MARSAVIPIRVTPEEKALVEAAARTAGLKTSEFLRREAGIGRFGSWAEIGVKKPPAARKREKPEIGYTAPELQEEAPDLETLTRRYERRFPSSRARKEAEREIAASAG